VKFLNQELFKDNEIMQQLTGDALDVGLKQGRTPEIIHYSRCLFVPKAGQEETKLDPIKALTKQYVVLLGFCQQGNKDDRGSLTQKFWQFILLEVSISPGANRRINIDPTRGSVFKVDENAQLSEGEFLFIANLS